MSSETAQAALGHFALLAARRIAAAQPLRGHAWLDRTAADHLVSAAHNLDSAARLLDQGLTDPERRKRYLEQAVDAAVYVVFASYILSLNSDPLPEGTA